MSERKKLRSSCSKSRVTLRLAVRVVIGTSSRRRLCCDAQYGRFTA
jgi:hypothetical protein